MSPRFRTFWRKGERRGLGEQDCAMSLKLVATFCVPLTLSISNVQHTLKGARVVMNKACRSTPSSPPGAEGQRGQTRRGKMNGASNSLDKSRPQLSPKNSVDYIKRVPRRVRKGKGIRVLYWAGWLGCVVVAGSNVRNKQMEHFFLVKMEQRQPVAIVFGDVLKYFRQIRHRSTLYQDS
jgi:hypothetical protein